MVSQGMDTSCFVCLAAASSTPCLHLHTTTTILLLHPLPAQHCCADGGHDHCHCGGASET